MGIGRIDKKYFFAMAVLLLVAAHENLANEGMRRLLQPIRPGVSSFARSSGTATESSDRGGQEISLQRYNFMWIEGRADTSATEWFYSFSLGGFNIDGELLLPVTGQKVDGLLQDIEFGLGHRRSLDEKMYGWFANLGSASDKPFDSYDEISIMANGFYKVSRSPTSAWMFLVNYSNRRSFLNNVPIPGAAYIYQPDRRTLVVAGMPFFMVSYPIGQSIDLTARYFVPDQVKIEGSAGLGSGLKILLGLDRNEDSHFIADYEGDDNSLYYEETRLFSGLRWKSTGSTTLELTVGYSLDRHFYQSDDSGDSDNGKVRLDDAADLRIALSHLF